MQGTLPPRESLQVEEDLAVFNLHREVLDAAHVRRHHLAVFELPGSLFGTAALAILGAVQTLPAYYFAWVLGGIAMAVRACCIALYIGSGNRL